MSERTGRTGAGLGPLMLILTVTCGAAAAVMIADAAAAGTPAGGQGLPDPGALTRFGLPAMRVVADVSAVLTIGFLLLAVFLARPQGTGFLDPAGFAAVRRAARAALAWTGSALSMAVLTASEVVGRPVLALVAEPTVLVAVVPEISASTGWLLTAGVAALVAIAAAAALTWGWVIGVLALAVVGLFPLAANGHSAGSGSHDLAVDSLLLHVAGAALWVGGLVAVLAVALQPATRASLPTALPRFSVLAGWCWALVAVSGAVNLLVRIPVEEVWRSTYGLLAVAKGAALLTLGAVGYLHRQRTVAAVGSGAGRAVLMRLGCVELLIMLATIGIAVGLGRTPPPTGGSAELPSAAAEELGHDLAGPPSAARLLLDWRPDLVMGTVALALLISYLSAVLRLRRRAEAWPIRRTASWITGCAVVVAATSSGIGRYANATLSAELGELLLLALVAPLFLAGGAPGALAAATGGTVPGSLAWALDRPAARWWLRPVVAIGVFAGVEVILLGGGLAVLLPTQVGRLVPELLMLASGSLLVASVLGQSRREWHASVLLAALLVVHAGVAAVLFLRSVPIAEEFYRALALPWAPDLLADQRSAALVWLTGVAPILVLFALLPRRASSDPPACTAQEMASVGRARPPHAGARPVPEVDPLPVDH